MLLDCSLEEKNNNKKQLMHENDNLFFFLVWHNDQIGQEKGDDFHV